MSERISVRVKLFGAFQIALGRETLDRSLAAGSTVDDLWRALRREHPALAARDLVRLNAVNLDYATGERALNDGDEVAFFPPVSGG